MFCSFNVSKIISSKFPVSEFSLQNNISGRNYLTNWTHITVSFPELCDLNLCILWVCIIVCVHICALVISFRRLPFQCTFIVTYWRHVDLKIHTHTQTQSVSWYYSSHNDDCLQTLQNTLGTITKLLLESQTPLLCGRWGWEQCVVNSPVRTALSM